ncbi:MAG TPA: RNA polymerase sigma factor, partial [Terriglobales bacterium]|nr:RNA polymerase sigma factor [Terriglobales bacterium]
MEIEHIYHEEWGRILATVIRLVGSFDLAEEAVQEAFTAALEQWPRDGIPENPRAWLIATARHKAVDHLRRAHRMELQDTDELARLSEAQQFTRPGAEESMPDERLSLIFTCCHPALSQESQVALTLRTLCGLSTEEIARAFLVPLPTMAQRLVRTKAKIRTAQIPYRVPDKLDLPERQDAVMLVVYLVFNEGYSASSGDSLVRRELCHEAIRLGRMLLELMPENPEVRGLLALMLLHHSRRNARTGPGNELITLEEQDRSLWQPDEIREGVALAEAALRAGSPGVYALQAAIAALHAQAACSADTDWQQIVGFYELLLAIQPSPVIALNHAAAVAMASGPAAGLRLLDQLHAAGELEGYYLLPAARADLLRRAGRWTEAAELYRFALALVKSAPERRFLERRLAE